MAVGGYSFFYRKGEVKIMTKRKIEEEFIYEELGFPLVLRNVPMIELRGQVALDVDLNLLQRVVLLTLAHYSAALTGNHIRFIRLWLQLTLEEFGELFGVTHAAVLKWEKSKNRSSKMSLTTERDLRLLLLDRLLTRDDDFRKAFKTVHQSKISGKVTPIVIDVPVDLVAV